MTPPFFYKIVLWMAAGLFLFGCATWLPGQQPMLEEQHFNDFVIVRADPTDSFASLAGRYWGDPNLGWHIARYNSLERLLPGQEVVIPSSPRGKGGLSQGGYQMVPILAYHNFSRTRAGKMRILERDFLAQMQYLKDHDYKVVTLAQVVDFINYNKPLPEKAVAITIDDGWRALYDIGFPILKAFGYPATLFVYTDFIGGRKALTWAQVKELAEAGIDIQCHSKTHRDLTQRHAEEGLDAYFMTLVQELGVSKALIKKKLGIDCRFFAYPYGKTDPLVSALVNKYGFEAAFSVKRGANPFFMNPLSIQRSVIYGNYDIQAFAKNLQTFQTAGIP